MGVFTWVEAMEVLLEGKERKHIYIEGAFTEALSVGVSKLLIH